MTSTNPTNAQRRDAARAQAQALRARQEASERRIRVVTFGVLALAVIALVVIAVLLFVRAHRDDAANAVEDLPLSQVADVPSTARADGAIPVGADRSAGGEAAEGVPEVAIVVDYMCPYCADFERVNKDAIEGFLADGTADVVVRPISMLDGASQGAAYSTRAASASAWVADRDPAHWLDFHEALFVDQPAEGSPGLTDDELARRATAVGVPADVADAIASGQARRTFGQWVASASAAASADPAFRGTPTITIDGQRWEGAWTDPTALPQAVADASR
ncbi:DsbA family protein [Xylanimonas ulmi]|uniref:Thioredoxin-like protein n=1 Tax=Xylanimonas ulmi TaxID=228973 RepID=A0A4Q7LZJ1_9MICO|nr:thioredoxin domain-containing protein [Xylanibacterium ulmi]RZS60404.1 thioredoxin-like protein [Xylanibacterium ulmi]